MRNADARGAARGLQAAGAELPTTSYTSSSCRSVAARKPLLKLLARAYSTQLLYVADATGAYARDRGGPADSNHSGMFGQLVSCPSRTCGQVDEGRGWSWAGAYLTSYRVAVCRDAIDYHR